MAPRERTDTPDAPNLRPVCLRAAFRIFREENAVDRTRGVFHRRALRLGRAGMTGPFPKNRFGANVSSTTNGRVYESPTDTFVTRARRP
jgi:hypothetical protein